jgi:uncharacterized protein (TIGR02266 family)
MGIERRRFPRINVKFFVEYRGEKIWQNAEVKDISKGGMFIITDKIEPPGTKIEVIFEFGKEERRVLQAEGFVVWSRDKDMTSEGLPMGMGIEFTKIFPQDGKDYLEELIQNWEGAEEESNNEQT